MKLTESINICYISDRVTCTVKVNIKETFMGNDGFLLNGKCEHNITQWFRWCHLL